MPAIPRCLLALAVTLAVAVHGMDHADGPQRKRAKTSEALQPSTRGGNPPALPEGWRKHYSQREKREYWFHARTGKSQWHPPEPPAPELAALALRRTPGTSALPPAPALAAPALRRPPGTSALPFGDALVSIGKPPQGRVVTPAARESGRNRLEGVVHHDPPPPPPQTVVDVRSNLVAATSAETRWAMGVLKSGNTKLAEHPHGSSLLDIVVDWVQKMMQNRKSGIPLRWSETPTQALATPNADPLLLACAMLAGHGYKNCKIGGQKIGGMDYYLSSRFEDSGRQNTCANVPNGGGRSLKLFRQDFGERFASQDTEKLPTMRERHYAVRAEGVGIMGDRSRGRQASLLHRAGYEPSQWTASRLSRIPWDLRDLNGPSVRRGDGTLAQPYLQQRKVSSENQHAGTIDTETLASVPEAKNFWPCRVFHGGKAMNARVRGEESFASILESHGFPFIGGASGSIEYAILAMEDTNAGAAPRGLVPDIHERERILGWHFALLVAGGMHSLAEGLAVAQAMGYFAEIPPVAAHSVTQVYAAAETYLATLGVKPASGEMKMQNVPSSAAAGAVAVGEGNGAKAAEEEEDARVRVPSVGRNEVFKSSEDEDAEEGDDGDAGAGAGAGS